MNVRLNEHDYLKKSKVKRTRSHKTAFRKEKTFDQLVKEQGVKPIDDFSVISGGWEDVDIDAFIREVRGSIG